MKTINILYGNNFQELFEASIKNIGSFLSDKSKENIIIVPDRLSLITEQKIFEILNISTYFNLSVMGISKFLNKIISDNNLNFLECTALQSKLLTIKAIQNTKSKFKCFSKNYTLGFVDEIFAKIEQIKSSNETITNLVDEHASLSTKYKFEDLSLIFNEYEKLRGERLDGSALISLFNNICAGSEYLKKCNVFFIGFDSMTKQGIEIVKNVTHNANYCFLSILKPAQGQPNFKLYDNSLNEQIQKLCLIENFNIQENAITNNPNTIKQTIQQNIFNRKNTFDNNKYFKIYKSNNVSDEIDFLIKKINYDIKINNLKFNEIAICTQDNYIPLIKSKLNNINVDCYSDSKINLISLEPIKYLLSLIKYLINNQKEELIKLVSNDFCKLNEENKNLLLNLINKYTSLNSIKKYETISEDINNFINDLFLLNIDKLNNANYYINFIKNIIKNEVFCQKIDNYCLIFKNSNEIELEKIYIQLNHKLETVLNEINEILSDTEFTLEEFVNLLESAFKNYEISSVPTTTNQIFIGNYKSFYNNAKHLYIFGANENSFPDILTDTGLISDKEILSQTIKAILEPTTKVINKRNKFKCIDVVLSATEKCYILYHQTDNQARFSPPSEIVDELKFLFNENDILTYNTLHPQNTPSIDNMCFNNINSYNANLNLHTTENTIIKNILKKSLSKNNQLYILAQPSNLYANFNELFFAQNKASISLIEQYNKCPRSCFLDKGLKLKPTEKDTIQANIIGSFIHEVAELFINHFKNKLGLLSVKEIEEFVNKTTKEIVKKDCYYSINLDDNIFIFNLITLECIRFCNFLNYEQTISEFKPLYTEKYFGPNSQFKPLEITIDNTIYYISGIVDRIDTYDNYFRIIDYKSGSPNFKNLADGLFYGTKLQLFVYSKAIDGNINKKLFGAFYLPVQNKFVKQNKANYSYMGFFLNLPEIAQKCDSTLNLETLKSNLLGCKLKKPDKKNNMVFWSNKNIISEEELSAFSKYALEIVTNTIVNMKNGYIECSPIKQTCDHCIYNKICNGKNNINLSRNKIYNTDNKNFMEINYD